MKYKIRTDIVKKICFYRGILIEDKEETLYFEKLLFSDEEINLGYRIVEIEEDIEIYISQELEGIIDQGLREYKIYFPKTTNEEVFIPPRRFL